MIAGSPLPASAARAALTAQFTGLRLATAWIQPGISAGDINTGERKVSGRRRKFTAPIRDSSFLTASAMARDSAPKGIASKIEQANKIATPAKPPPQRAP